MHFLLWQQKLLLPITTLFLSYGIIFIHLAASGPLPVGNDSVEPLPTHRDGGLISSVSRRDDGESGEDDFDKLMSHYQRSTPNDIENPTLPDSNQIFRSRVIQRIQNPPMIAFGILPSAQDMSLPPQPGEQDLALCSLRQPVQATDRVTEWIDSRLTFNMQTDQGVEIKETNNDSISLITGAQLQREISLKIRGQTPSHDQHDGDWPYIVDCEGWFVGFDAAGNMKFYSIFQPMMGRLPPIRQSLLRAGIGVSVAEFSNVLVALQAVHWAGYAHGSVKPGSLYYTGSDSFDNKRFRPVVKLGDFENIIKDVHTSKQRYYNKHMLFPAPGK